MKIVILRSNPVSPDSRVEKEANSLCKANYDVQIVAWDRTAQYKEKRGTVYLENAQVPITRFGIKGTFGGGMKKNLKPLVKFQLKLFKWLFKNRRNYQVIHACDFDTAFTAFICAKLFRKKLVYDIFDYYVHAYSVPNALKNMIRKIDHHIINEADATIICTEKRKEQIRGTKPKKIVVIHNSPNEVANTNEFSLKHVNGERIKIVYVGILQEGRFIRELVDIISRRTDCELHIGGFGTLENYIMKIASQYENIKYYGKIPYKKTLDLERQCHIITAIYDPKNLNNYYAAPNKFYEALMLGKPVIVVKNTSIDSIVLDNDIGEVIDFNKESLEKAIDNLIRKRTNWMDISKRMKEIYKEQFSWNEMEKRLEELYGEINIDLK